MKKVFLFLLIAIFVLGLVSSCSNNKEDFDFRKTKWGMKINEVIDIEAKSGNKKYKRESGAYEELIYENIDYKGLSIRLRYLFATESENKILAGAKFKEPILLIAHIQYLDDANQQLKDEIFKEFETLYGKYDDQFAINNIKVYAWKGKISTTTLAYGTPPYISVQASTDTLLKMYKEQTDK